MSSPWCPLLLLTLALHAATTWRLAAGSADGNATVGMAENAALGELANASMELAENATFGELAISAVWAAKIGAGHAEVLSNTSLAEVSQELQQLHEAANGAEESSDVPSQDGTTNGTTNLRGSQSAGLSAFSESVAQVYCVCDPGEHSRVCGAKFFTLLQCDHSCSDICHAKDMGWKGCVAFREVRWYWMLHYSWTDCPAD
mmetsp:Transcript_56706/g.184556  ORF Transcript_56706/g.184556 Transcript_56706/m.184556 type:complete len:202 (+) Transcript_56706:118-723(+)